MRQIKINMSDIGFGATFIGIQHGYKMIEKLKPDLAKKLNYIPYTLYAEDMKQTNKKFYNTVYEACLNIYNENLKDLEAGKLPILLGGDHSLALGSVKASMEANNEDIGLIWIDAHADINTFEISETGHIHGMPVASLLGLNDEKYNNLGNDMKIKFENLAYFATRAVDRDEQILIEKHNILELSDARICATSFEEKLIELINYFKGKVNKVHVSLDLDSINPDLIKGVSTPVTGGLSLEQPLEIIKKVNDNFEIVAIDIVEYNPMKDIDERTVAYVDKLISDLEQI